MARSDEESLRKGRVLLHNFEAHSLRTFFFVLRIISLQLYIRLDGQSEPQSLSSCSHPPHWKFGVAPAPLASQALTPTSQILAEIDNNLGAHLDSSDRVRLSGS